MLLELPKQNNIRKHSNNKYYSQSLLYLIQMPTITSFQKKICKGAGSFTITQRKDNTGRAADGPDTEISRKKLSKAMINM